MAEPETLTIEELLRATETMVELPGLRKELGVRKIRVRRLGRTEYFGLLPPLPTEAEDWPADEFQARERAWLESIGPDGGPGPAPRRRRCGGRTGNPGVLSASEAGRGRGGDARRCGRDARRCSLGFICRSRSVTRRDPFWPPTS